MLSKCLSRVEGNLVRRQVQSNGLSSVSCPLAIRNHQVLPALTAKSLFLGRALIRGEVRYVQEMARRIAAILLLEPALNANYESVKQHTFPWPQKP